LNWTGLRKNVKFPTDEKGQLIDPNNPEISISLQCELLGLSSSTYYYQPRDMGSFNLMLMNLIDEQFTRTLFCVVARMTDWLRK